MLHEYWYGWVPPFRLAEINPVHWVLSQEEFGKDEVEYVIKLGSFIVYEFTNEILHTESYTVRVYVPAERLLIVVWLLLSEYIGISITNL